MDKELIELDNQNLELAFQPAKINYDLDALKEDAEKTREKYKGYVVTPTTYGGDKHIAAAIRGKRKAVNEAKIKIKNATTVQVKQFEADIKDILKIYDEAVLPIAKGIAQLDEHAEKDREETLDQRISKIAKEYGVDPQKIEKDTKWLNKSARWSATEKSIREQCEHLAEQEKTRKEAVQVIQDKAESYTKPGMAASAYIDMLDHKSLPEILKQMDEDHQYLLEQSKKHAENKRKDIENLEKRGDKYIDPDTGEVVDKIYSITLKLAGTKEQLKQLSSFIKDWGIKYEKVDQ